MIISKHKQLRKSHDSVDVKENSIIALQMKKELKTEQNHDKEKKDGIYSSITRAETSAFQTSLHGSFIQELCHFRSTLKKLWPSNNDDYG